MMLLQACGHFSLLPFWLLVGIKVILFSTSKEGGNRTREEITYLLLLKPLEGLCNTA